MPPLERQPCINSLRTSRSPKPRHLPNVVVIPRDHRRTQSKFTSLSGMMSKASCYWLRICEIAEVFRRAVSSLSWSLPLA